MTEYPCGEEPQDVEKFEPLQPLPSRVRFLEARVQELEETLQRIQNKWRELNGEERR